MKNENEIKIEIKRIEKEIKTLENSTKKALLLSRAWTLKWVLDSE